VLVEQGNRFIDACTVFNCPETTSDSMLHLEETNAVHGLLGGHSVKQLVNQPISQSVTEWDSVS